MDNLIEFKKQMVADAVFQQIIRNEILPNMPTIPEYDAKADNTEEWKSQTYLRRGYILCFQELTGINLEDLNYE